jgi:hypothetical protein
MAYTDDLPLPTGCFFSPLERLALRSLWERQDMLDEIEYIPPAIGPRMNRPNQSRVEIDGRAVVHVVEEPYLVDVDGGVGGGGGVDACVAGAFRASGVCGTGFLGSGELAKQ